MAIIIQSGGGFDEFLRTGKTAQGAVTVFLNQKTKNVTFPIPFITIPNVKVDLDSDSNSIPYTINITLIGFQIKFKTNYTGNVSWSAIRVL